MPSCALKPAVLSTSWEKKMADKASAATFKAGRAEAVAARKAKLQVISPRCPDGTLASPPNYTDVQFAD